MIRVGLFGTTKLAVPDFTVSPLKHCKSNLSVSHSVWANLIATIRNSIGLRLDQGLREREQALARAFILGDRGRIERDDIEALRRAGLGHLLAISGLHMVAFAGTLFFLIRAGLALIPRLAEEYPIKKWAALGAFFWRRALFSNLGPVYSHSTGVFDDLDCLAGHYSGTPGTDLAQCCPGRFGYFSLAS